MKKSSLKILVSVLLVVILYSILFDKGYFDTLKEISLEDFFSLVLLTLVGYFTMGFQIGYMLKLQSGVKLELMDKLLLPLSMSLFGYIIPANGGLIYSVYFLKSKYDLDSSKGFSIGIVSIYISLIISGFFGLGMCFLDSVSGKLSIICLSIFLILSPAFVFISNKIIQLLNFKEGGFLFKAQVYLNEIVKSSNYLMNNKKILIMNFFYTFLYILITFVSFDLLNKLLNLKLDLVSVFLLLVITRVSSLLRVLPGNLGVEELYMAGIFKFVGADSGLGIIFNLILRLTTIVLFIPLGIIHFMLNIKYIKLKDLFRRNKGSKVEG